MPSARAARGGARQAISAHARGPGVAEAAEPPLTLRSSFLLPAPSLCSEFYFSNYNVVKGLAPSFPFMIRHGTNLDPYMIVEYGAQRARRSRRRRARVAARAGTHAALTVPSPPPYTRAPHPPARAQTLGARPRCRSTGSTRRG